MALKLILDRSIFHGERFDRFMQIISKLTAIKAICIYVTPMLLEETLRLLFKDQRKEELNKHLSFIVDISEKQWFHDNFDIIRSELGLFPLRKEYYFCEYSLKETIKENIDSIMRGGSLSPKDQESVIRGLTDNHIKADRMREIGKEIRIEISRKIKKTGIKQSEASERFKWRDFKKKSLDKFARDIIFNKNFKHNWFNWTAWFQWLLNRNRCTYFNEWITGMLYIQYYAMVYPNDPIDTNAQADIQSLIYLRHTDGIVSEDKGFMKRAWEDLYKASGKVYLSINDLEKRA